MSAQQHVTAILTVVNASLNAMATPRHAYDIDDAPTSGADYVTVMLHRRFGGNERMSGDLSPSGWRLVVVAVGASVPNARILLDRVTTALEGRRVTVGDETSTPVRFEQEQQPVEQDADGTWSGIRFFTYAF